MSVERQYLRQEVTQRQEEGCNVTDLAARVQAALDKDFGNDSDDDSVNDDLVALYDELDGLAPEPDFPYDEPSTLAEIRAQRPDGPRRMDVSLNDAQMLDRIHGAWLGRAAGCSLGKPVEGWQRSKIDQLLESTQALPLDDYLPWDEKSMAQGLRSSTRGNIEFMARDDDMDYPILGLLVLEEKGAHFTPRNMANVWLSRMPYFFLYTAERNAYRNFVQEAWPPASATRRNPHREWIGAQIRADVFGWVAPGWPEKAAELAFKDASISHVKNGIYGEMFVAAMLAAAYVTDDINEIIEIGLSEIPANCRLAEAVCNTLDWCQTLDDWEQVWDRIYERYGHYHGVHTINNAALVVMGLYFGRQDFQNGIVVAVRGGWDTDCNGATVGSILGLKFGADAVPDKWVGVLNDRLMSCVRDCNENRISDLAERTLRVANIIMTVEEPSEDASPGVAVDSPFVGHWTLTLDFATWRFHVAPDLTGTFEDTSSGNVSNLKEVTVDGNRVHFAFDVDKGGWSIELVLDGVIDGDHLRGDCMGNGAEFSVEGRRSPG